MRVVWVVPWVGGKAAALADAFDILGIEARFDVDAAEVRRAYLARAAQAHPDRAGVAGGAGGAGAFDAATLNRARATVEDAESRATELLARLGGPAKETDRSLPEGFLARVMVLREGLAGAEGEDAGAVERGLAEADELRAGHVARCGALFAQARTQGADGALLKAIRQELNAWRYIERMIEQVGSGRAGPGGPG